MKSNDTQSAKPNTQNLKILAIDDDADFLYAIKRILRRRGYENVEDFDDTNKALEVLSNNSHYDLILCDLRFPCGLDGPEFLSRVKEFYPNIPIVMLSCGMNPELEIKLKEDGALYALDKLAFNDKCQEILESI